MSLIMPMMFGKLIKSDQCQESIKINGEQMSNLIIKMFEQIQEPFSKYVPRDRLNFFSYSYFEDKCIDILKLKYFSILHTRLPQELCNIIIKYKFTPLDI